MQNQDIYYFKIFPLTVTFRKQVQKQVHPLNKYKIHAYKNSERCPNQTQWTYAGSHKGSIDIDDQNGIEFQIDNSFRAVLCALKIHELKYNSERDQVIGKHHIYVKNYIKKFRKQNMHYSFERAHFSTDITVAFEIFVEHTKEGLEQCIFQHRRQVSRNHDQEKSQESQIETPFLLELTEVNSRFRNITVETEEKQTKNLFHNFSHQGLQNDHKEKVHSNQNNLEKAQEPLQFQQNNNQSNQAQSIPLSPLKRLASEKIEYDLGSPDILKAKGKQMKQNLKVLETNAEKRKKLMEDFERKKAEFKKLINQTNKQHYELPHSISERKQLQNSFTSSRSVNSVRLSYILKTPQNKPWKKKEKQKLQVKKKQLFILLLIFMFYLLYVVIQPKRHSEFSEQIENFETEEAQQVRADQKTRRTVKQKTKTRKRAKSKNKRP